MADAPAVVRVSEQELRTLFNGAYLVPTLNGHLRITDFGPQTLYQNPPSGHGRQEPDGTISGLIEIIDPMDNSRVAVAHRLLRPDKTYGASGLPDPKMVIIDGTIYLQKRKDGRTPEDQRLPSLFTDGG